MLSKILFHNIKELVTMAPLAATGRVRRVTTADLGVLKDAWLATENGKILALGTGQPTSKVAHFHKIDVDGGTMMPGMVDAHSHPLYAGTRAHEFTQRLEGATYQEIAAQGGGIQSTVRATREASEAELVRLLLTRLEKTLRRGITTLEVKTGYGLSVAEELKLLRCFQTAKKIATQTLSITCLALHAKSPEHDTLAAYVEDCVTNLLPEIAKHKLADWVDAFIDHGYFSVADVEPYVAKAKELGLGIRIHADEFYDVGATAAAVKWGAASADHLQLASADSVAALAESGTVAVLLPGTSLYTKIPYVDGRRLYDAGVALAVATDFNPGSCQIDNLAMLAAVSSLHAGVPPAAAVAGVTYVAAHSLRLSESKGALIPGRDADLLIYELGGWQEWLGDFGRTPPREVWVHGARFHR
jgi:imidazolonepropionase